MTLSNEDVQELTRLLKPVKQELAEVHKEVTDLQLTLENETNRNIKLIAEGHLDLSRKLDRVLETENEKEMLLIRFNKIENDIRKIKDKLKHIA